MWISPVPLDVELRDAYLRRLGLDAEPPSVEALQQLHRRQVERVPYETMWIHAGEAWGIDPLESVKRVARHGRGGYCYHLNGALGALLRSLGYAVSGHVGGVHGPAGPDAESAGNHLVLMISDLPTDENPSGSGMSMPGSVMRYTRRCRCWQACTSRSRSVWCSTNPKTATVSGI
ncbi:MAG: N-hydroxyarylamine O-acetyltransferase [Actinomycetota bacterium]|nr:N-hydroxyarylamine O-acetyltransferase [Actinomycetota bacterium]